MKKILIAHQSTIPHYRVDFYNALEAARPNTWSFEVVFDSSELHKKSFFQDHLDTRSFAFPILEAKTYAIKFGEKTLSFQSFFWKASKYDMVVVGSALGNITYPLCSFYGRSRYVIWGNGKDFGVANPSPLKKIVEMFRSQLARSASGFMAYTPIVKEYLESKGVDPTKIYVLNNTVDILKQRRLYEKLQPEKKRIKQELGLSDKKIVLYVGRFIRNKRIDFLLQAFAHLLTFDSGFHLLMVGSGPYGHEHLPSKQVTFCGAITHPDKLAPFYIASDVFVFPGQVGLGPLQALCYDLPVIAVNSSTHSSEIIYLNHSNSLMLPSATTPEEYAEKIHELCKNSEKLATLRAGIWPSIKHLTIERMAQNFITGINSALQA